MESKTPQDDLLERQLFALVALLGIDEAIAILTRERERVVAAINGDRAALSAMTIEEFCTAFGPLPSVRKARPRTRRPKQHKALPGLPAEHQMHDVLKDAMESGPRPIKHLVTVLKRRGVVSDTSPETKRKVMEFLREDKTFAIRTRGVYAVRTRAA